MASWRDTLRRAGSTVHRQFEVPAVFLKHGGASPSRQLVRVQLKNQLSPILEMNDWANGASNFQQTDRVIFDMSTMPVQKPTKDGFVVVSATEVYRIGPSEPASNGYAMAEVTAVTGDQLTMLLAGQTTTDPAWVGIL